MTYWLAWGVFSAFNVGLLVVSSLNVRRTKRWLDEVAPVLREARSDRRRELGQGAPLIPVTPPQLRERPRHMCEPSYWPSSASDRWTCPECGLEHEAFDYSDNPVMMRLSRNGGLGWAALEGGAK